MTDAQASGSRTIPRWLVIGAAALAVAVTAGLLIAGMAASEDLSRTRATLAGREAELTVASTDLATTEASVANAHQDKDDRSRRAADLQDRVDEQATCIRAQQASFARLDVVQTNLVDNGNRLAEESEFAKAGDKRAEALGDALDAYYRAALARSQGKTSTARSWLAKARTYERREAAEREVQNRVLAEVAATASEIERAFAELDDQLVETRRTCGAGS